jgi:hypothetical protein
MLHVLQRPRKTSPQAQDAPSLSSRFHQAANDFAVYLHQPVSLLAVVINRILNPLGLNEEDVRKTLTLRHSANGFAGSAHAVADEAADLRTPVCHCLCDALALVIEPAGGIRTGLRQRPARDSDSL